MALIFQCDRCKATAPPRPATRHSTTDGPPPPPVRWATRQLAGDTHATVARLSRQALLCESCDSSLAAWFTTTPNLAAAIAQTADGRTLP